MKFSEQFNVQGAKSDSWFDPVLTVDTKLFVDPFLIYADEHEEFVGAHAEVIDFFNGVFELVARSGGDRNSFLWRRAVGILQFPEAEELCIGYSSGTTKGAGSGSGFASQITEALWEAVEAGLENITHFEEVGILRERIGADRISDITANILRVRFGNYTNRIAEENGIECSEYRYLRGQYNSTLQRWVPAKLLAPRNPYNGHPVLLVPKNYMRDLPTISAREFWNYCFDNENEMLRNDFGADITRNVDKETIIRFAKKRPDLRADFLRNVEDSPPTPYNFEKDPKGQVIWYEASSDYCESQPRQFGFSDIEEFKSFTESLSLEFQNYIENNGGWQLLWNERGYSKSENAAQFLYLGIVKHYCKANNIDISREPNIGRGPVDFKVSQGYEFRALLELKLAKNTKFWDGLTKQLPKYQEAEGVSIGYFIVIVYNDKDLERLAGIRARVEEVNASTGYEITAIVVDATYGPPSASKL